MLPFERTLWDYALLCPAVAAQESLGKELLRTGEFYARHTHRNPLKKAFPRVRPLLPPFLPSRAEFGDAAASLVQAVRPLRVCRWPCCRLSDSVPPYNLHTNAAWLYGVLPLTEIPVQRADLRPSRDARLLQGE